MVKRKIILFYPKPDKENTNVQLPLSVLAIASDLLSNGYAVDIIDERKEPDYKKNLPDRLKDAALFGVSAMTGYQIKGGLDVSGLVKTINSEILVVWGGWHVSMLPEETLKNPYIDIAVIGSGEGRLQEIYEKIVENVSFSEISGIAYKNGGWITINKRRNSLSNIQSISKEALGLVNMDDYIHKNELGYHSIFWVTSKGCPFNCGFCCSLKVYNRNWKGLEAERIVDDLELLAKEYAVDGVSFVDTNFFVDKERVVKMTQGIIQRSLDLRWAASVRVDQINLFDANFLELLKRSGCFKLYVGAESGSKDVLELIDKNISIPDTFNMAEILAKAGIVAEIFLMAGFPKEPLRDLKETLSLAKEIKRLYPNHQFTSFIYTPYPGTSLYDLAIENGLKVPSSLEDWANWNITEIMTPWIKTKRYSDKFHSFIKMYYPLAFPSDNLRQSFKDSQKGWIYWLLHKIESFRVKNNFFLIPLEWSAAKFINKLKNKYKIMNWLVNFR